MDLTELNKLGAAAANTYLPTVKITELPKNQEMRVTELRRVNTRYGRKVVLSLDSRYSIFLSGRLSEGLLNNEQTLKNLSENVKENSLVLVNTNNGDLQFSNNPSIILVSDA